MKRVNISPKFVEFIPDQLEEGILYISKKYGTIVHKCCCGCGEEVVTPLSPVEWQLKTNNNLITLQPSIGNWSFRCQSHYWIRSNRVVWAFAMSESEIRNIQTRDRLDKELYIDLLNKYKVKEEREYSVLYKAWDWFRDLWNRF